jgi:predicted ATPase/DNA-binding winged helix-turn-helix (wHTH) protein
MGQPTTSTPFQVDEVNQCLWLGTESISLSPKAFQVLSYLAARPGTLVSKQELLDAIWPDVHVTEGVLKRAILEIRKALADPVDEPRFIQTLHRRGYRFLRSSCDRQASTTRASGQPGIVGREREMVQLETWFQKALQGSRQIVFIAGEHGMGKTALIGHWMDSLGPKAAIGHGRCLQHFGTGEPYLPLFEALEHLNRTLGRRLVDILRAHAPTWLLEMPALISLEDRARLRDEVFGAPRERMVRELIAALEALAAETPVVLALEDLHWSDPFTVNLLAAIAMRTSPARLMIVVSYRPADAGSADAPLRAAQNELELHRQCQVLPLPNLTESETREYLATRAIDASAAVAAALHRRTNGNPLHLVSLTDELVRCGSEVEIGDLMPTTLQQMFERQAAQRTLVERELLDVAAVAGVSFSISAVAKALGWDEEQVESCCETLARRQIMLTRAHAESPGYAFIHSLCRDALYQAIPSRQRARLHARLAAGQEQRLRVMPAIAWRNIAPPALERACASVA